MKGPLRSECSVASVRMWSRRGAAGLTAEAANLAARRQSVDPGSLDAMVMRLWTEPREAMVCRGLQCGCRRCCTTLAPWDSQKSTLLAREVVARGSPGKLSGCRATRGTAETGDGGGGRRPRSNWDQVLKSRVSVG